MTEHSTLEPLQAERFREQARTDGELALALKGLTGGIRLSIGHQTVGLAVSDGMIVDGVPEAGPGVLTVSGDEDVWAPALRAAPPKGFVDISGPILGGALEYQGDPLLLWQYFPALQRVVELLRPKGGVVEAKLESPPTGTFDAPTGRYVHVELGGQGHRLYFEEAGQGIPLLLQHTAGSHGVQWRHLFECSAVTDHFRLIAYDLPFHGKSLPPTGPAWWADPYRLEGEFLRSVPVGLADALELDRPVFMGCSVGGLLALDLALHHPDRFRAVVSLEGALNIDGDLGALIGFSHPAVSNETKARMMDGLMAPTSPIEFRKETTQTYASGWPPLFLGDLHYYIEDFDIRERAGEIDTSRCGVHILSGDYDHSGTVELGREAHEAIAGSTYAVMEEMGHFPMSENPTRFLEYLLPVLEQVRAT